MLDQPSQTSGSGPDGSLLEAVHALSDELSAVRRVADAEMAARLVAAEDELAAIQEEVTQQQQEVADLQAGAGFDPATLIRRFVAVLPLATLLTNGVGQILEANPAAHEAIRVLQGELLGKPIFVYIATDDRTQLRTALSRAVAGVELIQVAARLTARRGIAVPAQLAMVREAGQNGAAGQNGEAGQNGDVRQIEEAGGVHVRWVILPDSSDGESPSHQQLQALTRLCGLGMDSVAGPEGPDLRSILGRLVHLCRQAIVEADEVSLFAGDPQAPSLAVATSAGAQQLDGLQHARVAGPSMDAYRSGNPAALAGPAAIAVDRGLRDDERAVALTSVLAVPLLVDELPAGVMTLYARQSQGLATLSALRQVMPFVEAAQSLLRDSRAHEELLRTQQQLQSALTSRAVIDQAKGMIMAELKCDADKAFALLVRLSGSRSVKVRDVAQSMVDEIASQARSAPEQERLNRGA